MEAKINYSSFTHGNALQIESPGDIPDFTHSGPGTSIRFYLPTFEIVQTKKGEGIPVNDITGRGSWFHMPLTTQITDSRYTNLRLISVTLLFETTFSRITKVHVFDGPVLIKAFDLTVPFIDGLRGNFSQSTVSAADNTFVLDEPHNVLYGVGLSFFACCFWEDVKDWDEKERESAASLLTVSAAGATYHCKAQIDFLSSASRSITTAVKSLFVQHP